MVEQEQPYFKMTPTEYIKSKCVELLFQNTEHNAKAYDDTEKHMFCAKTKDLSVFLERFTPVGRRDELIKWYRQLDGDIEELSKDSTVTKDRLNKATLELRYKYAVKVHEHNQRILLNSPIVEVEAEGEYDPTDVMMIDVIRGGKRTDNIPDGQFVFKRHD